jgi:hypothetical protein
VSARGLGKEVARRVQEGWLDAQGFSRSRTTFSRPREGYVEEYQIDGYRWNSGEAPWEFEVNVGVRFDGIPLKDGKGLWAKAHAVGDISRIVDGAPARFSVSLETLDAVAEAVARSVLAASARLPVLIAPARERAIAGFISPLPVPTTWTPAGDS